MPWIKLRLCRFAWFKTHSGPPPSVHITWVHVSWFDWDIWQDKMERALRAAREELKK